MKFELYWHSKKNNISFKEAYQQEYDLYENKWKAFWESLDLVCEGNIIYDFYWWFIWSNVNRLLAVPKDIRSRLRFRKERIHQSVASEDIWRWDDNILDYFYNGFKMFIQQTWGNDVESWSNEKWKLYEKGNHNRKFYNKLIDFQKNIEGLRYIRNEIWELTSPKRYQTTKEYSETLFNLTNEETTALNSAWKNLTYILSKYHQSLWT